jgi:hypothetical protein
VILTREQVEGARKRIYLMRYPGLGPGDWDCDTFESALAAYERVKALLEKNDGRNDMSNGSEADEAYLRGRESAMADVLRALEG